MKRERHPRVECRLSQDHAAEVKGHRSRAAEVGSHRALAMLAALVRGPTARGRRHFHADDRRGPAPCVGSKDGLALALALQAHDQIRGDEVDLRLLETPPEFPEDQPAGVHEHAIDAELESSLRHPLRPEDSLNKPAAGRGGADEVQARDLGVGESLEAPAQSADAYRSGRTNLGLPEVRVDDRDGPAAREEGARQVGDEACLARVGPAEHEDDPRLSGPCDRGRPGGVSRERCSRAHAGERPRRLSPRARRKPPRSAPGPRGSDRARTRTRCGGVGRSRSPPRARPPPGRLPAGTTSRPLSRAAPGR